MSSDDNSTTTSDDEALKATLETSRKTYLEAKSRLDQSGTWEEVKYVHIYYVYYTI